MSNFPKNPKPHYTKDKASKSAKVKVSKEVINEMVEIIRKAKKLRDEYSSSNNAVFS